MSADRKAPKNLAVIKGNLDDLVSFGEAVSHPPVSEPKGNLSPELTQRLLQIVKKLQEINDRIDRLSENY